MTRSNRLFFLYVLTISLLCLTVPPVQALSLTASTYGSGTAGVALADFDGNGRKEYAFRQANGVTLQNDLSGPGTFYGFGSNLEAFVAVDLNNDGKADIAALDSTDGKLYVVFNNGSGGLDLGGMLSFSLPADPANFQLKVLKLNSDALPDLLVIGTFDASTTPVQKLLPYINTGGNFSLGTPFTLGGSINSMVIADFDGDGTDELAYFYSPSGDPYLEVLKNNGSGVFSSVQNTFLSSPPEASEMSAARLIGSKPDLVFGDQLFVNNGTGGFPTTGTSFMRPTRFSDLDNDGDLDIIRLNGDIVGSNVVIYRNDGSGVFTELGTHAVTDYSRDFGVADLNGDGKPDIVTIVPFCEGGCTGTDTAVLLGTGAGAFAPALTFDTILGDIVDITDLDGNGYPDIVSAEGGNVSVLMGSGGSTPLLFSFTAQTNVALGAVVDSEVVTISGISATIPISIFGGQYAINGGAFTSDPGTVVNGDTVQVRIVAAASHGSTINAPLTVGPGGQSITVTFSVTTLNAPSVPGPGVTPPPPPADTTPDQFRFLDQIDVPFNALVESNTISITGIDTPVSLSVAGGEYRIGSGGWSSAPSMVGPDAVVTVRVRSGDSFGQTRRVTLSVGDISDTFSATTPSAVTTVIDTISGVSVTTVTDLEPNSQISKLPTTRCAKTDTLAASAYQFSGLSVVGQPTRDGTKPLLQTTPGAYGSLNSLAPAVLAGAVRISGEVPNRMLLAIGSCDQADVGYIRSSGGLDAGYNSNSAITVLRHNDGRLKVAVEVGPVVYRGQKPKAVVTEKPVLPLSAAEWLARNQFAAVLPDLTGRDILLHAGEVAEFDANGRLFQIRVGSLYGESYPLNNPNNIPKNPGDSIFWWSDPYTDARLPLGDQIGLYDNKAPLSFSVLIPKLNAPARRLAGRNLDQAIAEQFGATLIPPDPYRPVATWGIRLQNRAGTRIFDLIPVGAVRVEPTRADGIYQTGYGVVEVVTAQIVTTLAPAVPSVERFAKNMTEVFDPRTTVELGAYGTLRVITSGIVYLLRPDGEYSEYSPNQMVGCALIGGSLYTCQGRLTYIDSGIVYTLYPVFADYDALVTALGDMGPNAIVAGQADGQVNVQASINGIYGSYQLRPDYNLTKVPAGVGGNWWSGSNGKLYVVNRDGSGQGFAAGGAP